VLALFRTNQLIFSLLVLPYLLLVRISSFTDPISVGNEGAGIFSQYLYQLVPVNSLTAHVFALLLIFFHVVMINITADRFKFYDEPNQFAGLFYALLTSMVPDFLYLSPVLLANTFLILAFYELCRVYDKKSGSAAVFNLGFFVAMASLFYFSAISVLVLLVIGLNIQRGIRLVELLMAILGFCTPYFLLFTYYFWNDATGWWYDAQFGQTVSWFAVQLPDDFYGLVKLLIAILLIAIAIFNVGNLSIKRNIQIQKIQEILYWWLLVIPFGLLFQAFIRLDYLIFLMLPLAFLVSYLFLGLKKQSADAAHIVCVTFVVVFQYIKYLL
jgi:hypothetical protein